jgi:ribonucleotide reductase class II
VPSQSDKDENGNLLEDPFDERCTEWLVEIPTAVSWENIQGIDQIDVSKFSALAQFDFFMQVQKYWTGHNTSSTIEITEEEIEDVALRIFRAIDKNEGYVSTALLARFHDKKTYPRLPFEPIAREEYLKLHQEVLNRRKTHDFHAAINNSTPFNYLGVDLGSAPCDSEKCLMPEVTP